MHKPIIRRTAWTLAAASLGLVPAAGLAVVPLGPVVQVNADSTGSGTHRVPAIAADAVGDFVVVWHAQSAAELRGRLYRASGLPQGGEFVIASGFISTPALAMDADGDFVVAWGRDGAYTVNIHARRYNAAAEPLGTEFPISTESGNSPGVSVAMDADGDFVLAWSRNGVIRLRRYAAAGSALGGEFGVSADTTGQSDPAVAMDADGDFVVAWTASEPEPDPNTYAPVGVRARRFDSSGIAQGAVLTVNTYTTNGQNSPAVAMNAAGAFVIAWQSMAEPGIVFGGGPFPAFTTRYGIRARRYDAGGVAQGDEFPVNTVTPENQLGPTIAVDADGDFVIGWEGPSDDRSKGIDARRYDSAGVAQGDQFTVVPETGGNGRQPALCLDADGDLVVAWQGGLEGPGADILARRYRGTEAVDLSLIQADSADPAITGAVLTYTLRAFNLHPPVTTTTGAADLDAGIGAAAGVRILANLPEGYSGLNTSGSGWACAHTDRLRCNYSFPIFPGGAANPLRLSLIPPDAPGSEIRSLARVRDSHDDPVGGNNVDLETTRLVCPASNLQFSASLFSAAENAATLNLSVTRSGGACGAASVQIDTRAASALAGADYVDAAAVLRWADGETGDKTFAVSLLDDRLDELNETFRAVLGHAVGANLGSLVNVPARINDDDVAPRVNFSSRGQTLGEGAGTATLTVQLSEISGRSVSVPLVRSGTATSGTDYVAAVTALNFPAGIRTRSFAVNLIDDSAAEGLSETAIFGLGTPAGATVGSLGTHTLTITDNEP